MGQAGDTQCTGTSLGWMAGDCVFTGKWQKKGFLGEAAPALGFVFIFMYLFSKLWTKKGLWGHLYRSPDWTQTPPPFSAGLFLSPKSCQPVLGAGDPGDRQPEALLTLRCPQHLLHLSQCALPGWCCPWAAGSGAGACTSLPVGPALPTALSSPTKPHR